MFKCIHIITVIIFAYSAMATLSVVAFWNYVLNFELMEKLSQKQIFVVSMVSVQIRKASSEIIWSMS